MKILEKIVLGALVSTTHPLHAQTERGTVIVVYFSKDKIVVAADSLSLARGLGNEKTIYGCKVAALSKHMLFAANGLTGHSKSSFNLDPLPPWTAIGEAEKVFSEHPTEPLNALNARWAAALVSHLSYQVAFPAGRNEIETGPGTQGGVLTNGLFFRAPPSGELEGTFVAITYARGRLAPVTARVPDSVTPDICNSKIGHYCVSGDPSASDFVKEYLDLRSDRAKKEAEDWNQKPQSLHGDREAFRAKRLVELAIADDQTGHIGGEIDVAILPKNGTVMWAASPNCK